jgi:hypothetical protein
MWGLASNSPQNNNSCHLQKDTPLLMPYRRFANGSPGPAELATPSHRKARIWTSVAVRRPDTTRRPGYGQDCQQSPRIWLGHHGIAQYRRLCALCKSYHGPAEVSRAKRCTSSKHLESRRCAYYASRSRGGLLASVQRVAVKAKPRSYRPRILRGAPCAGGKGSPGHLRKKPLGWDGAFNGIPHGSTTLLAL